MQKILLYQLSIIYHVAKSPQAKTTPEYNQIAREIVQISTLRILIGLKANR